MKSSIARRITRRVSFLLLVALAVLIVGSYFLVADIIYSRNQTYLDAVAGFYGDFAIYNSSSTIDLDNVESVRISGDYICKWYGVDYAYMYLPDIENNTITYIFSSYNEEKVEPLENNLTGVTKEHVFGKNEIAVWNGEKTNAYFFGKNEISVIGCVQDENGNRFMVGVDYPAKKLASQIASFLFIIFILIAFVILFVYFSVYIIIRRKVSKPAKLISRRMQEFISDGERKSEKIHLDGKDEFSMIAEAFNNMTDDIDSYLDNIERLTSESVQQETQLDIASRIQKGFLPKERCNMISYDIRAAMHPAKNVGGDIYDYIPVDKNKILIVIADVSGKGIPASIFMAVTMMLIRQYAKLGLSPSEIMKQTNDVLSENNAAMLFATAFIGIYDSKTKTLTYSNAGHNLPYIISDKAQTLDSPSGTMLGLFKGEEYGESVHKFKNGDIFFMYTDGVTESVNHGREFFGEDRLEKVLDAYKMSGYEDITEFVREAVSDFSDGAEQYDDITMLSLYVRDSDKLLLKPEISEFSKIKNEILSLEISRQKKMNFCLAAEEWFVNICLYAFEETGKENEFVSFEILSDGDKAEMKFEHGGMHFNPLEIEMNIDEYDIDTQIGGLGNFIAFASVDEVSYDFIDNKNIMRFIQYLQEENQ